MRGRLDRDELFDMIGRITMDPLEKRGDVTRRKLSEVLLANPLYITATDSILMATTTMLDHKIAAHRLPPRRKDRQPRR